MVLLNDLYLKSLCRQNHIPSGVTVITTSWLNKRNSLCKHCNYGCGVVAAVALSLGIEFVFHDNNIEADSSVTD